MTGQWVRDPYGRAEFRYHDGTNWTSQVATGGVISTESPVAPHSTLPPPTMAPPGFSPGITPAFSPGFTPGSSPAALVGRRRRSNGHVIAAGVMEMVQAALALLFGVVLLVIPPDELDQSYTSAERPGLVVVGVVLVVLALALLAAGIGCLRAAQWGIVTTIVLQSLALLVNVASLFGAGPGGGATLGLGYVGVVLGLAISGLKRVNQA